MISKPRIVAGVKLGLVLVSPEWQPRAALDTEHIRDLHEAISAGRSVPALDVVEVDDGYALVDGYHRHAAMLAAGTRTCEVRVLAKGDRETARWWSYAANRGHGLKRTNADKRRSLRDALSHPFAGDMSNADLAEHCGVGLTLIAEVRKEMEAPAPKATAGARAAAAVAEEPNAGVRAIARKAGVSKAAAAKAIAEVSASTETNEADTTAGPTIAERAAGHDAVARLLAKVARDVDVMGGGLLPSYALQSIGDHIKRARTDALSSAPVDCPAHTMGASCMTCRGAGWVTQSTAEQIERAS